jgi:hypothetical protein
MMLGPQRPHADKGTGGELEVLGDTAIEFQSQLDIARVYPSDRVAAFEKAFFVKCVGSGLRRAPSNRA